MFIANQTLASKYLNLVFKVRLSRLVDLKNLANKAAKAHFRLSKHIFLYLEMKLETYERHYFPYIFIYIVTKM